MIEITIHPYKERLMEIWDNKYRLDLHPVHQDEEGNCYFRRQASLVQVFALISFNCLLSAAGFEMVVNIFSVLFSISMWIFMNKPRKK